MNRIPLENSALSFVQDSEKPTFVKKLHSDGYVEIDVEKGRKAIENLQTDTDMSNRPKVLIRDKSIAGIDVKIYSPLVSPIAKPNTILYIHGGGWVFGDDRTHDLLLRKLVTMTSSILVFPMYSRSPEAKFPQAINELYEVAKYINNNRIQLSNTKNLIVAGDSAGGNMAIALTLLAKKRGDVKFTGQMLFYPVTDTTFNTESYKKFATGYHLTRGAMRWFFDQYEPDVKKRKDVLISPLGASIKDLADLPPALIVTAEADVLRDEGEMYASKLRAAGVDVSAIRCLSIIHDFLMLNRLQESNAANIALNAISYFLKEKISIEHKMFSMNK